MKPSERGVDPKILLGLIDNTAPFLFQDKAPLTPYTEFLLELHTREKITLSHFDYFRLCLSAHYTTVATFVPTDVDNQIRKHLWTGKDSEKMAELVLTSLPWDFRPVTTRYQEAEGTYVSGHQGEWFSVAVGAYACHREKNPELAKTVKEKILTETKAEARLFQALKKKKDGIGLLKACTLLSHNLGDLDRVIDQWELPADDPLRKLVYKLGHETNAAFGPEQENLLQSGALNKEFMASENHRHYPLRKPKCLRKSIDLLLPIGPFFDTWGEKVARHPALEAKEKAEVASALLEGFERLSSPKIPLYGYARALGGMLRAFPGGQQRLLENLPSKTAKLISTGPIAQIHQSPQFDAVWSKKALNFLKIL